LTQTEFRLIPFRSPLLRESLLLSFPRGTEMFQFPRFPHPALCVQAGVTTHDGGWVSPFGHPRIVARSTAPHGFSQSPTSFIGSRCQGIHRWLFVAWKNSYKDARARSAVLKGHARRRARSTRLNLGAFGHSFTTEERTRPPDAVSYSNCVIDDPPVHQPEALTRMGQRGSLERR
jgi:hypothetical protein